MKNIFIFTVFVVLFGCSSNNSQLVKNIEKNSDRLSELEMNISDNTIKISQFVESFDMEENLSLKTKVQILDSELSRLMKIISEMEKQLLLQNKQIENNSQIEQIEQQPIIEKTEEKGKDEKIESSQVESDYTLARKFYLESKYDLALKAFNNLINNNPDHSLSINAQYWIGEVYYDQDNYIKALAEFQKVVDFYPTSAKAPDAQLKIGLCYKKLGKTEQAILELKRIIKMFPAYERQNKVTKLLKELE